MTIRSRVTVAALLAAITSGAAAGEPISPSSVLAAKGAPRGVSGFADRTARISSIMGAELSRPTAMRTPTRKPVLRREADALAGQR